MIQANPVEIELMPNTSSLYIFFGGIAAGIAMPPLEFYNSAKIINESKIFVRDFAQCWYHDGLPGIGEDIDSTANFLLKEIQKLNPQKVFFVGNSMGGYAAILFSALIGCGEVIAFVPQTFISPIIRLKYLDFRWTRQICKTYFKSLFKRKVWDLHALLLENNKNQKISIFVSKKHRLDCIHAHHLENIAGVSIFEFNSGGHGVVKLLRDTGKLPAIMSGNFS